MKKLLFILLIAPWLGFSQQVPQAINYQAVARDDGGQPIPNQSISILFEINSGGPAGPVVYEEYHQTSTNSLGLFDVQIGRGNVISGNFSAIDWGLSSYYATIYMDENGGGAYDMLGSFELISVPYALYAEVAGNANTDTDDQILTLSNDTLYIQDGNYVVLPPGAVDTDDQQLSLSNDTVYLQDGGYVVLPPSTDEQDLILSNDTLYIENGNGFVYLENYRDDADADATNEIQTISKNTNGEIELSLGGGAVTDEVDDADADATNELQTISKNTNGDIELSNGGGTVTDEVDDADADPANEVITNVVLNGSDLEITEAGTQTTTDLSSLINDADADATNEIQTLSKNATSGDIELSNGGGSVPDEVDDADADPVNEIQDLVFNNHVLSLNLIGTPTYVDLSPYLDNTDNQTLTYDANTGQLSISGGNNVMLGASGGDGWGADVAQTDVTLSGDGTATSPLGLSDQGATNGQVLQFNGTSWVPATPTDNVDDADNDPSNEIITTVALNGNDLEITEAGTLISTDLSSLIDDADADPSNEIQTISKNANGEIELSLGGGTVTDEVDDADANPTNEIQTLTKDPNTGVISLTNGGTVADWVDDADADPANEVITSTATNATTLQIIEAGITHNIDMTPFIDDADADATNELQNLSFDPVTGVLTIGSSGSSSVTLPTSSGGGDNWGTQTANTQYPISGTGLSGTPISLVQGSQSGQMLTWSGTQWVLLVPTDNVDDADNIPTNELITNFTYNPTLQQLELTEGGNSYTLDLSSLSDNDGDPTNELISSAFFNTVSNTLQIIEPGNVVNVSLNGYSDNDSDPLNEIQILAYDQVTGILQLNHSSGNQSVDISSLDTDDQLLDIWNDGTNYNISITDGNSLILPGGGGTLDNAYDYGGPGAGKKIIADAGSVQITGQDGLVVHSNSGANADLSFTTMTAGNVMYFNPDHASFRAGRFVGNEWQYAQTGFTSFAANNETVASGPNSSAFGNESEASGAQAFATGNLTEAIGQNSFAQGDQTEATNFASAAFGSLTSASGQYSFASGSSTLASGQYSFAAGSDTEASGGGSTSFGSQTRATTWYALSSGFGTAALGQSSFSSGSNTNAKGSSSFTGGSQTTAKTFAEFVIGQYNDTSIANNNLSWVGADPVFVVGNGSFISNNNALTVFKDGRVAINTVSTVANASLDLKLFVEGVSYGSKYIETGEYFLIPSTANSTIGVIQQDNEVVFHSKDNNSVYVGANAGNFSSTTASNNTSLGRNSLGSITGANSNTAVGFQSSSSMSTGINNVSYGAYSLQNHTASNYNTAIGTYSLNLQTSGDNNTAVGHKALETTTSGNGNTAIGSEAADDPGVIINQCTFLGFQSNSNATSAINNSMALGYSSQVSASNQIRLGDGNITSIGGSAAWTNTSDRRLKKNVADSPIGLDFIMSLRPVRYEMIEGHEGIAYTGFIAQEVESAAQELGYEFSGVDTPDNENDHYGLRYATFTVPLVNAVQEQQEMIDELRTENESLKAQMEEMWKRLEALEQE
jgi:hypothetical protein